MQKSTDKLAVQTNLVSTKSFRPNKFSNYIIGNESGMIEKSSQEIKRSTYCPNLTHSVLKYLATNKNSKNLYLLGVKYIDKKGDDIQAGISETRHYNESSIDNALRGITEELHISIDKNSLCKFGEKYNHHHFIIEINDNSQYKFVDISNILPDPTLDDNTNKGKASVYVFGTLENLLPILQKYQPPTGSPHDPIDFLCMIPFSDLKNF
jgi:hypothetical protein